MIRAIVFISVFILLSQSLRAQSGTDTIRIKYSWLGPSYKYQGRNLNYRRTNKLLSSDPAADKIWKKAKRDRVIALPLSTAGAACLLVYVFSNGQPYQNAFGFVGVGLAVASVPFSIPFRIRTHEAIKVYNKDHGGMGYNEQGMNLNLFFTGNRAGVALQF